jgi:hypothetical protein
VKLLIVGAMTCTMQLNKTLKVIKSLVTFTAVTDVKSTGIQCFYKFIQMHFTLPYFIYRLISVFCVTVVVQASIVLRFKKAPNLLVHDLFVGVVLHHVQKIE